MKKLMLYLLAIFSAIVAVGGVEAAAAPPGSVDQQTYHSLIAELLQVGTGGSQPDGKLRLNGEVRYHHAANDGAAAWNRDSAGLRVYLGFDTALYRDWQVYGRLEGKRDWLNDTEDFKLSRLYLAGKTGETAIQAGSFGYLMGGGNIYDSSFDGIRADFGGPVKYTLSYGETNSSKKTAIATARYDDFDYQLEAGVYHYQTDAGDSNTIRTLGGSYHFSNFSLGGLLLDSSLQAPGSSGTGYVLSLDYGGLKTWQAGTYEVFADYYNQPAGTYIAHGMNGTGGRMQGFSGYRMGLNYALAKNLSAGLEYYHLTDKVSGAGSKTWWSQISYYF